MLVGAGKAMPAAEKEALEEWERHHIPLGLGTSDWPGWKKYLPERPTAEGEGSGNSYKKGTIPPDVRWEVWARDNFTCVKCGVRKRLAVDHVMPESKGGTLSLGNLQTLCRSCNSKKGSRNSDLEFL